MIELTEREALICNMALIKIDTFWSYIASTPWVNATEEEIQALIDKTSCLSPEEIAEIKKEALEESIKFKWVHL